MISFFRLILVTKIDELAEGYNITQIDLQFFTSSSELFICKNRN